MIRKLRWKFILTNMLCVLLMLLITFALIVSMTGRSMVKESLFALREAYMPEKSVQEKEERPETVKKDEPRPEGEERKEKRDEKGHHMPTFQLRYDKSGSLVVSGSDVFDLSDPSYLTGILDQAEAEGKEYGLLWSENLIYMRVEREGRALYVFGDIFTERTTMEGLIWDSVTIGCICLLGFFLISVLLSRWAVKPTERAWAKQKQFVADASHELKTPLTVIGTNAELLQNEALTGEQRERCAESIVVMTRQMRMLTEELLTLARTDDTGHDIPVEALNWSDLVEDTVLSFEALLFEVGLTLESDLPAEPLRCKGNEGNLRQLTEILLDNAKKYSLSGEVRVEMVQQHNHGILTVSNPATPLTEEELQHLFDRFYRADQARATSGYGLGLSIAQNIVLRHGGQINAAYEDGRITFRVRLPLA